MSLAENKYYKEIEPDPKNPYYKSVKIRQTPSTGFTNQPIVEPKEQAVEMQKEGKPILIPDDWTIDLTEGIDKNLSQEQHNTIITNKIEKLKTAFPDLEYIDKGNVKSLKVPKGNKKLNEAVYRYLKNIPQEDNSPYLNKGKEISTDEITVESTQPKGIYESFVKPQLEVIKDPTQIVEKTKEWFSNAKNYIKEATMWDYSNPQDARNRFMDKFKNLGDNFYELGNKINKGLNGDYVELTNGLMGIAFSPFTLAETISSVVPGGKFVYDALMIEPEIAGGLINDIVSSIDMPEKYKELVTNIGMLGALHFKGKVAKKYLEGRLSETEIKNIIKETQKEVTEKYDPITKIDKEIQDYENELKTTKDEKRFDELNKLIEQKEAEKENFGRFATMKIYEKPQETPLLEEPKNRMYVDEKGNIVNQKQFDEFQTEKIKSKEPLGYTDYLETISDNVKKDLKEAKTNDLINTLESDKQKLTDDLVNAKPEEVKDKLKEIKDKEKTIEEVKQILKPEEVANATKEEKVKDDNSPQYTETDRGGIPPETSSSNRTEQGTKTEEVKIKPEGKDLIVNGTLIPFESLKIWDNVKANTELFKEVSRIGLEKVKTVGKKYIDWAREMIKTVGDWVKPHLKNLWEEINKPIPAVQELINEGADVNAMGFMGFMKKQPKQLSYLEFGKDNYGKIKASEMRGAYEDYLKNPEKQLDYSKIPIKTAKHRIKMGEKEGEVNYNPNTVHSSIKDFIEEENKNNFDLINKLKRNRITDKQAITKAKDLASKLKDEKIMSIKRGETMPIEEHLAVVGYATKRLEEIGLNPNSTPLDLSNGALMYFKAKGVTSEVARSTRGIQLAPKLPIESIKLFVDKVPEEYRADIKALLDKTIKENNPDWLDKLRYYLYNAMLTRPVTHLRNIIGNISHLGYESMLIGVTDPMAVIRGLRNGLKTVKPDLKRIWNEGGDMNKFQDLGKQYEPKDRKSV